MPLIYKICSKALWQEARKTGIFAGAPIDLTDGYIHFSTSAQLKETAVKQFANVDKLVLVAVESMLLGKALKWEPSRGGDLFPHLYSPLELRSVQWVKELVMLDDGTHDFMNLFDWESD